LQIFIVIQAFCNPRLPRLDGKDSANRIETLSLLVPCLLLLGGIAMTLTNADLAELRSVPDPNESVLALITVMENKLSAMTVFGFVVLALILIAYAVNIVRFIKTGDAHSAGPAQRWTYVNRLTSIPGIKK
jgi:hypothetical protein